MLMVVHLDRPERAARRRRQDLADAVQCVPQRQVTRRLPPEVPEQRAAGRIAE